MTSYAIRADGLSKRYGRAMALEGFDLTAPEGTVCGLLGPNGAGKTTAVRILATLLDADGGRAWVGGFDVAREADEVRFRIGLTGQYPAVDGILTGRQNRETSPGSTTTRRARPGSGPMNCWRGSGWWGRVASRPSRRAFPPGLQLSPPAGSVNWARGARALPERTGGTGPDRGWRDTVRSDTA